jgi:hypothetical protein
MLVWKNAYLKLFLKLLLGFAIYLCLRLPEKIAFGNGGSGQRNTAVEFFSLLALAMFIGLAVGFNSKVVSAKKILVSMLGAIIGGLLLGVLQLINLRSIEVMFFLIPSLSIVMALSIYYKSFFNIVLGMIGSFVANFASVFLLAVGALFSRGWWGPPPFPKLGDLPLVLSCLIIGFILVVGIDMGDYWQRARERWSGE